MLKAFELSPPISEEVQTLARDDDSRTDCVTSVEPHLCHVESRRDIFVLQRFRRWSTARSAKQKTLAGRRGFCFFAAEVLVTAAAVAVAGAAVGIAVVLRLAGRVMPGCAMAVAVMLPRLLLLLLLSLRAVAVARRTRIAIGGATSRARAHVIPRVVCVSAGRAARRARPVRTG